MLRRLALLLALGACSRPAAPPAPPASTDVDAWAAEKATRARAEGVRPGNEERLVRHAEGATPLAILYIHGFGASRGEGEAVIDPLAQALGANLYYTRLPGHGVDDPEALDAPSWRDYVDVVEEAFAMSRLLGEDLVLVGSSTGGLLATHLAAAHPDEVAAVVLVSPFYAFANPSGVLLDIPGGYALVRLSIGELRDAGWGPGDDPEGRVGPDYNRYWTTLQRTATLRTLARLRRELARDEVYAGVRAPVLLLHHYADADHQDDVASVPAMRAAYHAFNGGRPHPASRLTAIADGNHILLSEHLRTDKDAIRAELAAFFGGLGLTL